MFHAGIAVEIATPAAMRADKKAMTQSCTLTVHFDCALCRCQTGVYAVNERVKRSIMKQAIKYNAPSRGPGAQGGAGAPPARLRKHMHECVCSAVVPRCRNRI
jgi:hypothetical protein